MHLANENTGLLLIHSVEAAHILIIHSLIGYSQFGYTIIIPVLDVLQKMCENGYRNNIALILTLPHLHGNADQLVIGDDRAAAVSGINCSVDLTGE